MTGLKLYEIGGEMLRVEEMLDDYARDHMGDITDFPYADHYDSLVGQRDVKLLNLGSWFKSLKAEAEAYANELKSLQSKKKVVENKMQWIKDFIGSYIKDGEKLKDSRVSLSWRKSESVEIDDDKFDLRNLTEEFKVITQSVDKAKVKTAMKLGKEFEGILLVEKNNLQVK